MKVPSFFIPQKNQDSFWFGFSRTLVALAAIYLLVVFCNYIVILVVAGVFIVGMLSTFKNLK